MTLYDYVRLFQREWRRLLATFLVLVCGASLLPLRLYVATLPTYQATLLLLVPEKARERTIAQLNSRNWVEHFGLLPDETITAVVAPLGLIHIQVMAKTRVRSAELGYTIWKAWKAQREDARDQDRRFLLKLDQEILHAQKRLFNAPSPSRAVELYYTDTMKRREQAYAEYVNAAPGELIDGPTITPVSWWTGWKLAQALISIVVASVLISVAMVLVREWWREETKRRG